MTSASLDSAVNYIADFAANLGVDKLFLKLGVDPAHITYDALSQRLTELALTNINTANMLALAGAMFYVATLMMRTIVPLRVIGIISIAFFMAYGLVAGAVGTFLLYLLSLPVNVIRLRQMLTLVKKARMSSQGDLSMDWLRPYMTPRKYRKGEVLFRKGDVANEIGCQCVRHPRAAWIPRRRRCGSRRRRERRGGWAAPSRPGLSPPQRTRPQWLPRRRPHG